MIFSGHMIEEIVDLSGAIEKPEEFELLKERLDSVGLYSPDSLYHGFGYENLRGVLSSELDLGSGEIYCSTEKDMQLAYHFDNNSCNIFWFAYQSFKPAILVLDPNHLDFRECWLYSWNDSTRKKEAVRCVVHLRG